MPFITLDTNAKTEVTSEMLAELGQIVVEVMEKPWDSMIVKINTGMKMRFGNVDANVGVLGEVKAVGFGDKKAMLAERIRDFAVQHFGADGKYVGIHFVDMPATNASHNGKLMA